MDWGQLVKGRGVWVDFKASWYDTTKRAEILSKREQEWSKFKSLSEDVEVEGRNEGGEGK